MSGAERLLRQRQTPPLSLSLGVAWRGVGGGVGRVPVGQRPQEWKAPSFSGSLEAL
jgi:hypothetical protein